MTLCLFSTCSRKHVQNFLSAIKNVHEIKWFHSNRSSCNCIWSPLSWHVYQFESIVMNWAFSELRWESCFRIWFLRDVTKPIDFTLLLSETAVMVYIYLHLDKYNNLPSQVKKNYCRKKLELSFCHKNRSLHCPYSHTVTTVEPHFWKFKGHNFKVPGGIRLVMELVFHFMLLYPNRFSKVLISQETISRVFLEILF